MELVHDFTVPVPADQAWTVLTDIERIAPCMPGASITSVEGGAFEGGMTIKLGPIGMTFKGAGSFVAKDVDAKRAVIETKGRDAKGNGGAQAVVTASLSEANGTTNVPVVTDLNVSGKAAQFGGGVMKDVSNRMLAQFANKLAQQLAVDPLTTHQAADGPRPADGVSASPTTTRNQYTSFNAPTADDSGIEVMSLLVGSGSTQKSVNAAGIFVFGVAFGFALGKNHAMERQLRNV